MPLRFLSLILIIVTFGCSRQPMIVQLPPQPQQSQTSEDGDYELIWAKPQYEPAWVSQPGLESNSMDIAFKGISPEAAQLMDSERLASREARVAIGDFLFSHIDGRVSELIKFSGRRSERYDPTVTEETVRDIVSNVFVSRAYPTKTYTMHFRRRERGFWTYHYQTQALVKYPRDQVASAATEAYRRTLGQLRETAVQQDANLEELQAIDQALNQSAATTGNIWALVVGIDKYRQGVRPLQYAAKDAKTFASALKEAMAEEWQKQQVDLMTDEGNNATTVNTMADKPTDNMIMSRLQTLTSQVGVNDIFIFYFSGHGFSENGEYYLASLRADPSGTGALKTTSIRVDDIRRLLYQCNARHIVLILDSCRSEPSGFNENLAGGLYKRLVVEGRTPKNYAALFACSDGESAYEDADTQHGVFSYYLLKGFRGAAADSSGHVTVNRLAAYVQTQVAKWCENHLPKKQMPRLYLDSDKPIVLR